MNFACCGNRNPQEPASSVVSFGGINEYQRYIPTSNELQNMGRSNDIDDY